MRMPRIWPVNRDPSSTRPYLPAPGAGRLANGVQRPSRAGVRACKGPVMGAVGPRLGGVLPPRGGSRGNDPAATCGPGVAHCTRMHRSPPPTANRNSSPASLYASTRLGVCLCPGGRRDAGPLRHVLLRPGGVAHCTRMHRSPPPIANRNSSPTGLYASTRLGRLPVPGVAAVPAPSAKSAASVTFLLRLGGLC
jgi:hypothetical protein